MGVGVLPEPGKQPRSWILLQIARGGARKAAAESQDPRGRSPARPGAAAGSLGDGGCRATSGAPSPERTPRSSARAVRADPRARQLFPTSRLPLPLLSASPLPLLCKPRHQRRRRHTRSSEGLGSSRAPRAPTHLLQPARPLPGPAPAPQAPEPGARLAAQRPDSPGCKETFLWPPGSPTRLWADSAASASSRAAGAPSLAAPGSVSPAPGVRSPILRPLAHTPQTLTGDELPLGQVLRVALFAAGHCPGIYSGIARRAALMRGASGGGPSCRCRRCRCCRRRRASSSARVGVLAFFPPLPLLPSLPPLLLYFALSSMLFFVLFAKRKKIIKRKENPRSKI